MITRNGEIVTFDEKVILFINFFFDYNFFLMLILLQNYSILRKDSNEFTVLLYFSKQIIISINH